jgi:hypothetical protein
VGLNHRIKQSGTCCLGEGSDQCPKEVGWHDDRGKGKERQKKKKGMLAAEGGSMSNRGVAIVK